MSRGWCQTLSILSVWKRKKLQGSQTRSPLRTSRDLVWKRKKLQDSQTNLKIDPKSLGFWKKIKVHGTQTARTVWFQHTLVWKKIKLQDRKWYQMLFHFLKRSEKAKLQGSQEYRPHPKPMVIWKEIELQWHDTQTSYWQRAVWKRIKLQGSQTSCRSLIRA